MRIPLWVGNEHHTGGYQPFGDLYIQLGHKNFSNYRRELDISRAVQAVKYVSGGVTQEESPTKGLSFYQAHAWRLAGAQFSPQILLKILQTKS
jgi:Na+(H+)/acetate symporter ActP